MISKIHSILSKPVAYLQAKISPRQFFVLSSILVGLSSGLAAIVLKYFVHSIERFVSYYSQYLEEFLVFGLFPFIGILITVAYIRYILKNEFKKGTSEIVYAIVKKSSHLPPSQMYSHMVTSALTVGFGGSTGLESPMVSTGSAIGSNYAQAYNLSYKDRTILLACGASAGIAAAFNSPIAGVLFAVEVLLADVSASAFVPLIISAASGALLSKVILKEGFTISFSLQQPFNYHNVPYYIVLGILAGLVSLYYTRTFTAIDRRMTKIKNQWIRALVGGLLLFLLMFLFPPLFGEGYETIKALANLNAQVLVQKTILQNFIHSEAYFLIFLGLLVLFKAVAAALTLG